MVERVLINRQYAKLWAAGAVSWIGDYVFDTTVLLWIATVLAKDQPWAPAATGGVLIAVIVPTIVASPFAGVFVDRWDPRKLMLWTDAIRGILVGVLAIFATLPAGAIPVSGMLTIVYVVVALSTIASRFFTPARMTIVADVVPADMQAKAAGLGQGTMSLAGIIGPPLAAPLLFTVGVEWALLINALSFIWSFAVIYGVKVQRTKPAETAESEGFWAELAAGFRVVFTSRALVALIVTAIIVNFAAEMFNTLDVFFVTVNLSTDPKFFGLLGMAFSVGAVAGAFATEMITNRLGLTKTFCLGLLSGGICIIAYARSTNFVVALILMTLAAVGISATNTVLGPIVMRIVPRNLLGRVFALLQPAVSMMSIVGIGLAGWLASSALRDLDTEVIGARFRTYDTIFLLAGILIVLGALYGLLALRGTDKSPTETSELPTARSESTSSI